MSHDTPNLPLDELQAEHTPEAIRSRLEEGPAHSYLKDFIYGAIDGIITTFAVVSGVAGAELSAGIIVILGVANLLGDGFSMAVSNYLGTQADEQLREKARRTERDHISRNPSGEREEIRQIFAAKGFAGEDLERAVDLITADRKRWIDTMLTEEFGLSLEGPNPLRAAAVTLTAFVTIGALPLLAFIYDLAAPPGFELPAPFLVSAAMTAAAFFIVGALKSRFVEQSWWRAGLQTLLIGGIAAALAYGAGVFLKGVVPV